MKMIKAALGGRDNKVKFAYVFVAVLVTSAFLMNFISLQGLLLGKIIFAEAIAVQNALFLFVFSFLAALVIIMHLYKRNAMLKRNAGRESVGAAGAAIGMFTSACPVCYPLILTLIGVPAAMAALPFGGAEIQAASIALLLLSIFFVSRECKSCNTANRGSIQNKGETGGVA